MTEERGYRIMKMKKGEPNRLINEKSPYLLQHAYNPVDWFPWSGEAFEKARRDDKPIFLSIGYSTCHWCHVMERESFEDEEVAKVLNDSFVCIKVDREEHPDVDAVYMAVCQAMTGSGGWPLTVFLTPDREPFFAGTYFPKNSGYGRPGIKELAQQIFHLWSDRRQELLHSAGKIVEGLKGALEGIKTGKEPGKETLAKAYAQLSRSFDPVYGGFGAAPKFPMPLYLSFLLRYDKRTNNPACLALVEKTLAAMGKGGIYDHIGFGFHRYSTDRKWLLPHFEKMLYDQALISLAYLEAYQVTGNPLYASKVKEIFTYVMRDLTDPKGAFYSAEDADSEGVEGRFYLWRDGELKQVLGEKEYRAAALVYNIDPEGNYADETAAKTGFNILHLKKDPGEIAAALQVRKEDLPERLEKMRRPLFACREKRVRPHRDDKILTDWNGLMIAALARGGRVLAAEAEAYLEAAEKAASFICMKMMTPEGRLKKRYRDNETKGNAYAADYAFFIWGLLELYQATFKTDYLKKALELEDMFIESYWDDEEGGFFLAARDDDELPLKVKEIDDGAVPSANSAAALNLLKLARITGKKELAEKAEAIGRSFAGNITGNPAAYTYYLSALDFQLGPVFEVVIAGDRNNPETRKMLQKLNSPFIPGAVFLFKDTGNKEERENLEEIAPLTRGKEKLDGKTTVYVCRDYTCLAPVTDPQKALSLLL